MRPPPIKNSEHTLHATCQWANLAKLGLQHTITATKHAKGESTHNINSSCYVENNSPFTLTLIAHNVSGKNRADDARDGAYDIFNTEHVTCYEGSDVEVITCGLML